MIVPVVHPVPVLHIPRRARTTRLGYLRRESSVEIPEADASEFTRVPYSPRRAYTISRLAEHGRELYERDGRLWHPLRDLRLPGRGPRRMARDSFAARLSRGLSDSWSVVPGDAFGADRGDDLLLHFTRTPLLANRYTLTPWGAPCHTGIADLDGLAGTRILRDMTTEADAGLREFLSREVALVGDGVFVRVAGPMAVQFQGEMPGYRTTLFPRARATYGNACRVDQVEAFVELRSRHGMRGDHPDAGGRLLDEDATADVPGHLFPDDDLVLHAAGLYDSLRFRFDLHARDRGADEEFAGHHASVQVASALAPLGIMAAGSVEAQLLAYLEATDMLGGLCGLGDRAHAFDRDLIESFALPRLRRDGPVDDADAEALAGFGPGL